MQGNFYFIIYNFYKKKRRLVFASIIKIMEIIVDYFEHAGLAPTAALLFRGALHLSVHHAESADDILARLATPLRVSD